MPGGALRKLKITGYSDDGFDTLADVDPNPIVAMINPSRYSQRIETAFTKEDAAGGTGKAVAFNKQLGQTFDLSLVFDGTGVVPDAPTKTVDQQIADLRKLAFDVNGKTHEPNFVALNWGTLNFKGRLKSLDIDYTLFAPDGTPLRATVKAAFVGFHDNGDARAAQNLSSPDLTHSVTVHAGDTLPLICYRVYGDSAYYLKVAAYNRLDDFRNLPPGTNLLLPPLSGARS